MADLHTKSLFKLCVHIVEFLYSTVIKFNFANLSKERSLDISGKSEISTKYELAVALRIFCYSELEGTHKGHQVQLLAPRRTTQKNIPYV